MPTLAAYLHAAQERLGAFQTFETGVLKADGSTRSGVATGADANKMLVSDELARTDFSGTGGDILIDTFDGSWVLPEGSSQQRRLVPSGWVTNAASSNVTTSTNSSAVVGYLVTDRAFSSVQAAGQTVGIYPWVPPLQASDLKPSLRTFVNRALGSQRMIWRHRLTSTAANLYRFDLGALTSSASTESNLLPWLATGVAGWLTNQVQIGGVYSDLSSAQTYLEPYAFGGGGQIRLDGATPYLVLQQAVGTGKSIYADFLRPRHTWIKPQGMTAYANSTAGLVALGDEATGPLRETAVIAAYYAADHLSRTDPTGYQAVWAAERDRLAEIARPYLQWMQPEPVNVWGEHRGYGDHPTFRRRRWSGRSGRWP